jgi:hypothetical protein
MKRTNKTSELYCDTRIGGVKRWYIGRPEDADMNLPGNIQNCVCFLCGKNRDGSYKYGGTGFFVAVPSERSPDRAYAYLITAKHNLENAKAEGYYNIYLRINTTDGNADFISVAETEWVYHEDEAIDVAVLPLRFDVPEHWEFTFLPVAMAADEGVIQSKGIGLGDELAVIGLFTSRRGDKKNIPIARTGIISAMPEEPLTDTRSGLPYDAYLAEIRSIGGLSGSPVFVFKYSVDGYTQNMGLALGTTKTYLLGLIRGHWDLGQYTSSTDFASKFVEEFNAGIAIVTPVKGMLDILYGGEQMKDRKNRDKLFIDEDAPKLDSGFSESSGADNLTREGFEDALKQASRKISPPDEETKET